MDLGNNQQQTRRLKKGELLFAEGERSRAMYLLKSGAIRLFLKKGDSNIEIDTVRPGQILGELAFLDGNPRSVSGEALMECELVEISGPMFMEVLGKTPEWLKLLLKTVVGRLRAANTRIRQLESANVAIDYSDKEGGKRSSTYQFVTFIEFMKISSALLLVGTRNAKENSEGLDIDLGLVVRYSNQMMGVPVAKISGVLDVLTQIGLAKTREENGNPRVYLKDLSFLEQIIQFLNEENQLESAKRHDISVKGALIMSLIVKHLTKFPQEPRAGFVTVDVVAIKDAEAKTAGRDPFRNEDLSELVKLGFVSDLKIKSNNQAFTTFNLEEFLRNQRFMQVVAAIKALNEQKRQVGKSSKAA